MKRKELECMTPLERAVYVRRLAETSEKIANLSVVFSIVAIILMLIANLDKIVAFVYWLQSCLGWTI